MKRNPVIIIWAVAGLAALLAYLGDADAVLAVVAQAVRQGLDTLGAVLDRLDLIRPGVVRALAIGLFVAFVLLAALAIQRGRKGRAALVLVTAGFAWSINAQEGWLGALALSGTAAAVMTARVADRRALVRV